jgi:hypothetical protein
MIKGGFLTQTDVQETRLTAVITRADGRVEDLGTIAYYNKNPLRQLAWRVTQFLKGRKA